MAAARSGSLRTSEFDVTFTVTFFFVARSFRVITPF
jgi:hypothetical protein